MPAPTWTVEAAWDDPIQGGSAAGFFKIGVSQIGGTDKIAGPLAFGTWTSVPEVKALRITRGANDDLTDLRAGECQLTLKDSAGKYNPLNTASALNGKLNPMRPLRVKATHPLTLTEYHLFFGFITEIEHNPDPTVRESYITAVDLFEWLANSFPTVAALGSTTVDAALREILVAVGWGSSTLRDLDAGRTMPDFSADATATALSLIQDLMAVDRGLFFIAADGKATYRSPATLFKVGTAVATYTQSLLGVVRPATQVRRIINKQVVTKTGNAAQTAENSTSQQNYAVRVGSAITSAYLNNDAQADSLAKWIVGERKDPIKPARRITLSNKTDALLTEQLSRDLGALVTVTENLGGTAVTGHIRGIEHETEQAGLALRTTFTVAEKSRTWFTIGSSKIDSADVIGY